MHDPFKHMKAKDGFHVVRIAEGTVHVLYCVSYYGGQQVEVVPGDGGLVEIYPADTERVPDEVELPGHVERLGLALQAVARYLTTGGDWGELNDALNRMQRIAVGGLVYDGYHVYRTYLTDQGDYQHVFASNEDLGDDTPVVVWEEPTVNESGNVIGGGFNFTTLGGYWGAQDVIEAEQSGGSEASGFNGAAPLLSLPHREDPGEEEAGR